MPFDAATLNRIDAAYEVDIESTRPDGTTRTTIQRVKFIGQSKAAIYNAPRGIDNTFTDNDYSQIDATAVPITRNR